MIFFTKKGGYFGQFYRLITNFKAYLFEEKLLGEYDKEIFFKYTCFEKKINKLKSVYFKKTVARSSVHSKVKIMILFNNKSAEFVLIIEKDQNFE